MSDRKNIEDKKVENGHPPRKNRKTQMQISIPLKTVMRPTHKLPACRTGRGYT
jgi:hypothetical protein